MTDFSTWSPFEIEVGSVYSLALVNQNNPNILTKKETKECERLEKSQEKLRNDDLESRTSSKEKAQARKIKETPPQEKMDFVRTALEKFQNFKDFPFGKKAAPEPAAVVTEGGFQVRVSLCVMTFMTFALINHVGVLLKAL